MNNPAFSVIIPCFNANDTIEHIVSLVLNQSFNDFEIIIVDDKSTDKSAEVIKNLCKMDERIKCIFHEENTGQGPARNSGLKIAKGEYVLFFDADDEIERDLLLKVNEITKKHFPDLLVYSLSEEYDNGTSFIHKRPTKFFSNPEEIHREIAWLEQETMLGYPWNKAYKKSVLVGNNIIFESILHIEDILFNLRVAEHINSLFVMEDVLYHYKNAGMAGSTAKKLPNYFALQKQRITEFLKLQDKWQNKDSNVNKTAAALYFRSFVSAMERDIESGIDKKNVICKAKDEIKGKLFSRLSPYVTGGRLAKLLYKPLSEGKIEKTYNRAKCIHFIKRNFPGVFNRLKQSR